MSSDHAEPRLNATFPSWAFWHHIGGFGAIHRETGVIVYAPDEGSLERSVETLDSALSVTIWGTDKTADLGDGVDQSLVSQRGHDLPRGTAGDAELLDERDLGRDGVARPVDPVSDSAAQLLGDLLPPGRVPPVDDHDTTVEGHGRG